jgi:hypothetical protein
VKFSHIIEEPLCHFYISFMSVILNHRVLLLVNFLEHSCVTDFFSGPDSYLYINDFLTCFTISPYNCKFSSNGCTFISSLQLCGNNPYVMTRCAQMLEERTHIDFIDVNLGCPIELVYQQVEYSFS